ncbi:MULTISPECIES: hypothetical protein [unclassified Acidiphilium]|uniref:hypothetical protein n=1 Tax=unclassified Acidiphilium TaxID=2617493 RepID=UPI000BD23D31|nr:MULTISPECIES: hypothetical protein [unclassified Acidiphilium]OYV67763.1 MAG: hypothetical protein B7X09_00255 [Acidiphilium sp. 21-66-27]HQT62362.1 hypothetical protein [Acidiphilium sp.]
MTCKCQSPVVSSLDLGLRLPESLRLLHARPPRRRGPDIPTPAQAASRARHRSHTEAWAVLFPAPPSSPGQFHPQGRPSGYVPPPRTRSPPGR